MTIAFDISEEDIIAAAKEHLGIDLSFDEAEGLMNKLDRSKIEEAALYGNDLETQTTYAVEAISEQLHEMNTLPVSHAPKPF